MKYLFSETGIRDLGSRDLAKTLFAFDFDGTLAPIQENPSEVRLSPSTERLFGRLCAAATVAVISGRSIEDLRERLGSCQPRYLIGNHGLEGVSSIEVPRASASGICRGWIEALQQRLSLEELEPHEIEIEDKELSLAIHYRKSQRREWCLALIRRCLTDLSPTPREIPGKCVLNLIPPGSPHKGTALIELMRQLGVRSSIYIGDDDTDEDVFALTEARIGRILTARVGRMPSSFAKFFIHDPSEIDSLLEVLLSGLALDLGRG